MWGIKARLPTACPQVLHSSKFFTCATDVDRSFHRAQSQRVKGGLWILFLSKVRDFRRTPLHGNEIHDLPDIPNVIGHASGHRRSDPKRLVDAREVVVHKVEGDRGDVVLDLLREGVRPSVDSQSRPLMDT